MNSGAVLFEELIVPFSTGSLQLVNNLRGVLMRWSIAAIAVFATFFEPSVPILTRVKNTSMPGRNFLGDDIEVDAAHTRRCPGKVFAVSYTHLTLPTSDLV